VRFTLAIHLGNEAMQTTRDLGHALIDLGMTLTQRPQDEKISLRGSGIIRDANGNTVGTWTVSK